MNPILRKLSVDLGDVGDFERGYMSKEPHKSFTNKYWP